MKKIKATIILITVSMICFIKCNSLISKDEINIINQELIYDSINYKIKGFKVNLYSSLEFNKKNITREEYNNFFLIVQKDTFPLIPEVNYLEKKCNNDVIKIKYISMINFESKKYDNDSISNIIKNSSRIINSKGQEINKKETYNVNPIITLYSHKDNGLKLQ